MPQHADPMDVDEPARKGLFAQSHFVVVRSPGITEDTAQQVRAKTTVVGNVLIQTAY